MARRKSHCQGAPKALKPGDDHDEKREDQRKTGAPKDGQRLLGVHVAKKTSRVPAQEEARPPPMVDDELLDIDDVCRFFGGSKPLHPATIYRGLGHRFPRPVKVGPNSNRWLKSECEAALREMAAERREAGVDAAANLLGGYYESK